MEPHTNEHVTVKVTYRTTASVTDESIEKIAGFPNFSGSGLGLRDMGWTFPQKDNEKINTLVTKLRELDEIIVEVYVSDADGGLIE